MRYDGPIIDPHIHLLTRDFDRYPWLKTENAFAPPDIWSVIQADYLLDDYRRAVAGHHVVGSVHMDAGWNEESDPVDETRWLESLEHDSQLIGRYVASAPFGTADSEQIIRGQAAFSRVVGIRRTIQWHPALGDANPRTPEQTREPAWRESVGAVERAGLLLELLLYPWQVDEALELARLYPELPIVVDHALSPVDQSPDGVAAWRLAITRLATARNVRIKLSSIQGYLALAGTLSDRSVAELVDHVLGAFGTDRAMFASDFPVGRMTGLTWAEVFEQYRGAVESLSADEQHDLFYATASRVYRFDSAL